MYIKSLSGRYNLVEFNFYGTNVGNDTIFILELLIDCPIDKFEPIEGVITIEENQQIYIFNDFKIDEWYQAGEYIKVVCIK